MPTKAAMFEATRPLVVDARQTHRSSIALLALVREIRTRNPETVVELVVRNERSIKADVLSWCRRTGNELLGCEVGEGGELRCLVQKGVGCVEERKKVMTVVVSMAGLEQVVGSLDKAVAGGVLGMDVNIVFEASGVRLLRTGYRSIISGAFGKWFTAMTEGILRRQLGCPLPRESIEILCELGAKFWVDEQALRCYGVRDEDLLIKGHEAIGVVGVVDLLEKSDIRIFSGGAFEKP